MNIFFVEDDNIASEILNEILKKYGNVVSASDGESAVEIYKDYSEKGIFFDYIFLDIMLPMKDGMTVLAEIRKYQEKDANKSKIYIISALDDQETIMDAYRHGCDGYVGKPIFSEKIRTLIEGAE